MLTQNMSQKIKFLLKVYRYFNQQIVLSVHIKQICEYRENEILFFICIRHILPFKKFLLPTIADIISVYLIFCGA